MRLTIAVAAISLAISQPASAGFQEGVEAAKRGHLAIALREFRPLAEQGHPRAQTYLGVMYQWGHGVHADYEEAVRWYRMAAEQGEAEAQMLLGSMYEYGKGTPPDYVQAHKWYELAASMFLAMDKEGLLNAAAKNRDNIASVMTPEQIAAAQKLAREWLTQFERRGGK